MKAIKKHFWTIYLGLIVLYIILGYFIISYNLNQKRDELINNLQTRAESLIWTIEGASRAFGNQKESHKDSINSAGNFESAFKEMSLQPGIAWISIVNANGKILLDSNPQVVGLSLYPKNELETLKPETYLKSRFSPDEPNIFESWKQFLNKPSKIIFVGLEADFFWQYLESELDSDLIIAILLAAALFSSLALFFYINNYFLTKRELYDVKNLSLQIIQNYPAALFVTNGENIITYSNQKANDFFQKIITSGDKIKNIENLPLKNLPGPDWSGIINQVITGKQIYDQEKTLFAAGENPVPINVICAPIYGNKNIDNKPLGFMFAIRNLAQIKKFKEEYEKDLHFSSIGKLAAGIAHEIRNPLSSICGYAHYLYQKIDDPFSKSIAVLMEEEGKRLNRVVTDLVTATQIQQLNKVNANFPEIINKALLLLKDDCESKNIRTIFECDPRAKDFKLFADKDKLLQVIINLLLNAIQASGNNSDIHISLTFINDSDTKNDNMYDNKDNNLSENYGKWQLNIRDTGCGMSEETLKHVFTPYFTTKETGAGLGLAMCRQIIESHGGKIKAESAPNQGSIFTVILPS